MKKLISVIAIGGIVAGGIALSTPTAQASGNSVGSCNGLKGLGTAKSSVINTNTGKNYGLAYDQRDVTISTKGVATDYPGTNMGTCTFTNTNAGTPGTLGTLNVTKWGAKVFSAQTDCNQTDNPDVTEYSPNGKIGYQFNGGTVKLDGYIRIDGFLPTRTNGVKLLGTVTKGNAVGATISGSIFFSPVIKSTAATNALGNPTATDNGIFPKYDLDLAGAIDCQVGSGGTLNGITGLIIGDNGVSDPLNVLALLPLNGAVSGIGFDV